jgi:hypothetical protein
VAENNMELPPYRGNLRSCWKEDFEFDTGLDVLNP